MDHSNRHTKNPYRTITTIGNGEVRVEPNYAELRIEVVTQSRDINEAQRENANIMNRVIRSLLQLNVAQEDIQTASFNIFPQYDYVEGRQVFRGYEVTNAISVKVRNVQEVGRVIDMAVQSGANRISSIEFKLENENMYYHQSLQMALLDAISKARTIAETLKLPYVPQPIEIVESSTEEPPVLYRAGAMTQESAQTPIEIGLISIKAKVTVNFQY